METDRKNLNNRILYHKKSIIFLMFLLLTLADLCIYLKMNSFFTGTDTLFHFSRVQEIYENLKEGSIFTWISTHYFHQTGVGSYIFYPDLFLYIWALLKFVFSPVRAFYIWIGFFIFLTYICSFYAMYSFCQKIKRSIYFSLIYTIMPYHLFVGLWNGTLGEFLAYTFLPIAFVGIYHIFWGNTDKWYLLAIGMSLILYSHIVSAFIIGIFISIVIIWKAIISQSLIKQRIISFIKAVVFSVLLTCPFWFLFLIEGSVATPKNSFIVLHDLTDIINLSVNNTIGSGIGLILLVTVLLGGIVSYKNKTSFIIYLIGLFFFIASSNIIPYKVFNHVGLLLNTVGLIQMPGRLLSFSSVFLSVIAAEIIDEIINRFNHPKIITSLVLMFSIILFWSETQPQYDLLAKSPELTSVQKSEDILPIVKKITDKNYSNLFKYIMPAGETDYYHRTKYLLHSEVNNTTKSIINHVCYINNEKITKSPTVGPNKITYTIESQRISKVDLPVVFYKSDQVSVNNHKVDKTMSDRGTIQVKVSSGVNHIEVQFAPPVIEYVLMLISLLSWLYLIVLRVIIIS